MWTAVHSSDIPRNTNLYTSTIPAECYGMNDHGTVKHVCGGTLRARLVSASQIRWKEDMVVFQKKK